VTGNIGSIINSNYPKGIEPATFLARSSVPQPTAPPRVPITIINLQNTLALTADMVKYELQIYLFIIPAFYMAIKKYHTHF